VAIWTALLAWQQMRTEKRREIETISTTLATKEQDLDQPDHLGHTVEKV
jgi:ACS family pantothenate transporter-like MFS transporter